VVTLPSTSKVGLKGKENATPSVNDPYSNPFGHADNLSNNNSQGRKFSEVRLSMDSNKLSAKDL
jgi:hypothetical protein